MPRKAPHRRAALAAGLLGALLGSLLLTGCLSDGPNQVGGDYLDRQGILLETPVYKVTLDSFPLDSFWIEDLSPSRLGDTILLLGVEDGFSSQMRLAFNIPDTALVDSLDADSSLRLSLGFPKPTVAAAPLESTLVGATQMKVQVESWVVKDTGLDPKVRAESLLVRTRRFLIRQDTSTLIPGTPVLDTLVLNLSQVYKSAVPDSIQARFLAKLRDTLRTDPKAQWLVQMQLTPLPDSADSGSQKMLRLGGNLGAFFMPSLLFGTKAKSSVDAAAVTQKVYPVVMPEYFNRPGTNYKVRFTGDPSSILVGKNQGLHLRINRTTFLNSLEAALQAQNINLKRSADGEFDLGYFVPFASIRLPIDTSWSGPDFSLQFRLFTDLDSLLPAPDRKASSRAVVGLGVDTVLVVTTDASRHVDTLRFAYGAPPQDAGLRRVILRSSRFPTIVDTVYFHFGETRPIIPSVSTSADRLVLTVTADSAAAQVSIHVNTKSAEENNFFRDPATGEPITSVNARIPTFFKPGVNDSLDMRATRSFQRIMNRARLGEEITSDLFVQPAQNPAFDPATNAAVPYPVVGELRPALDAGKLSIGITLYLYPLKDRR